MSKMVNDFLRSRRTRNGYGFFEGVSEVVEFSRKVGKRERRAYERYYEDKKKLKIAELVKDLK